MMKMLSFREGKRSVLATWLDLNQGLDDSETCFFHENALLA